MMGIVKDGIPVGIVPTTLTPYSSFKCNSADSAVPRIKATSAPGISGRKRLITRIRMMAPTPSARE